MYSQYLALLAAVGTASAVARGHQGHQGYGNRETSATSTAILSTSSSSIVSAVAATAVPTNEDVSSGAATSSSYCGAPNDYEVISDTPWIVYSMNYNYEDISGSCCTGYYGYTGSGENQTIHWDSVWDIDEAVSTDVVKGYSFIGLTQNLETTLDSISSIPSTYQWTVSNTTAYKGKTSLSKHAETKL